MPDIRDVLKGLSIEDRALYTDIRTQMRRAYLSAHSKLLPIDKYETSDDAFLDLIDIKIAMLFDRAGTFDHSQGNLNTAQAINIEKEVTNNFETAATRMIKSQIVNNGRAATQGWPQNA